ncbi:hypothetical protein [Nocardioides ferulae]|uniref:hypothetical protein n=1 Tax=Nocardioides ferulae TaxID=2340821 RepID=UPI000EB579D2|nr:hypothetical protein [Nocardioides ferulae]
MASSTPPPYAGVPGAVPTPPRKPRPSGWWFAVGVFLLVAAVGAGVGLFWWTLSGFFSTDDSVPVDGRPHQVSVGTDGDRMLWTEELLTTTCTIVDSESGQVIPQDDVGADFTRATRGPQMIGSTTFDPGSGRLEVTCVDEFAGGPGADGGEVEIGPAPKIANFALGIIAGIVVPLLLGLAGFIVLLVTGILFATRPARPKG